MSTDTLYEYPDDYVGRKTYVSLRGHSRSVPKYKTYRGTDGYRHLLPQYGGDGSALTGVAPDIIPDKAGYVSPINRKYVDGRAAHREHMNRHDVYEAGDMRMGESAGRENSPMESPRFDIRRAIAELS